LWVVHKKNIIKRLGEKIIENMNLPKYQPNVYRAKHELLVKFANKQRIYKGELVKVIKHQNHQTTGIYAELQNPYDGKFFGYLQYDNQEEFDKQWMKNL